MDETPALTNPSIEVSKHQAIMNIYTQLADLTLTTAEDCLDAAQTLTTLEALDVEGWMDYTPE